MLPLKFLFGVAHTIPYLHEYSWRFWAVEKPEGWEMREWVDRGPVFNVKGVKFEVLPSN